MKLCPTCGAMDPSGCKNARCPFLVTYSHAARAEHSKQEYAGQSPNIFIGRYGYPNVNVGILSNENVTAEYDAPRLWSKEGYTIPSILSYRTQLINSRVKGNVKTFSERLKDVAQDVAMASKPVDVDVKLDRKPTFGITFNREATPFGPAVGLQSAAVTSNPRVDRHVEAVVSDTDLKATDAVKTLVEKNVDEHALTKLMSVGLLGTKTKRKMVPTRWAITAVDDTIGKQVIDDIHDLPRLDECRLHIGSYLGNHYFVMLIPSEWSYELFEVMLRKTDWNDPELNWSTDHEFYAGRKDYASDTVGGYYAARIAVTEKMRSDRIQASAFVIRLVTSDYTHPLGVWVVREATRKAMESAPKTFATRQEMLRFVSDHIKRHFNYDCSRIITGSKLLAYLGTQRRLGDFA
ncbi:MAG: hypothetical protein ABIH41_02150 [Nanoarchaeota archaeon]